MKVNELLEMGEPLAGVKLDAEELDGGEEEVQESAIADPAREPQRPQMPKGKKPLDLSTIPEFREYQSRQDQRIAGLEKSLAEAKALAQAAQADRVKRRQEEILGRLQQGTASPQELQELLEEYATARSTQQRSALSEWEQAKKKLIAEAELNESDFPDDTYQNDPNTAWYRLVADVHQRRVQAMAEKMKALEAQVAGLPKEAKKQAIKTLAEAGGMAFDAGADGQATDEDDAWATDLEKVQQGKMTPTAYMKRWGARQ